MDGDQNLLITRYLDTAGNGTGTKNAIGDQSGPTDFYIQPSTTQVFQIRRLIVSVEDAPTMRAEYYGGLAAALTNGIEVLVTNGVNTIQDLTDGVPIKNNGQWGQTCYDVDVKTWGAGDELLLVRWTFGEAGQTIRLEGDLEERFVVRLNDDFTGLVAHRFKVQGFIEGTANR